MISVTRLNGKRIVVHAEQIRTVESNPDTTLILLNGDHILVRESMDEVVSLVVDYGRSLRQMMPRT